MTFFSWGIGYCIGAAIGAQVAYWYARRRARERETEILRICLAEFDYWQESGDAEGADDTRQAIAIGAIGASSNIRAAVMGHPAEWHKPDWVRLTGDVASKGLERAV